MLGSLPDEQNLVSPILHVGTTPLVISFQHRFPFENGGWDGGVIEISSDSGAFELRIGSNWPASALEAAEGHMISRDRLTVLLAGLTMFLFQTHWVDDLGTGDPDVPGITVAAIGGMLLVTGLLLRRRVVGVAGLGLGFLFVALVSAADLRGLDTTGTAAPDILVHWRDGLGWGFTLAVALTLALSMAGMVLLLTNVRLGIRRRTP